jgi:hypothetical protein
MRAGTRAFIEDVAGLVGRVESLPVSRRPILDGKVFEVTHV